eukprot:EG_transcript_8923
MAPDALRLEAFYELRIFGLQVVRAAEVLAKVRAIVCGLQHACRPKNDFRLTFQDMETIQSIERAMSRPSTRRIFERCRDEASFPNLAEIGMTLLDVHSIFKQDLAPRFYDGFCSGDTIFYDLHNRQRVGLEICPNMLLELQKAYDRFSHSGLYLCDTDGGPALFHGLRVKLKRLTWLDAVYMPRRCIDLAKVFIGFAHLSVEDQERVSKAYQRAVQRLAHAQDDYNFDPPSLIAGLGMFITPRVYTPTPATVSRRGSRGRGGDPPLSGRSRGAPPPLLSTPDAALPSPDVSPNKGSQPAYTPLSTTATSPSSGSTAPPQDSPVVGARLTSLEGQDVSGHGDPTPSERPTVPPLQNGAGGPAAPPAAAELPEASAMLCSGFTASTLVDCMREVQRSLPDLRCALQFCPKFTVDVQRMTPGDLHSWPIWRTWEDDEARAGQARFYIFADEVFSRWWATDRALC